MMRRSRRKLSLLIVALALLITQGDASAQFMILTGGDITLTLGLPTVPGGDPAPVTNASRRLIWLFPPNGVSKIVVSTAIISQSFELYVTPTAIRNGTAMPTVQLTQGMSPVDFIRDIGRRPWFGRATLSYRAEAPAETGSTNNQGTDVHTVIYTWIAQ